MNDQDSELDDELQRLPAPRAPRTLLPRVMAAVGQRASAPWYSRAWVTWPRALQLGSASAALLVVVAIAWGLPALVLRSSVLQSAGDVATLARVFWQTWLQPLASYVGAALIALSLVCFAAYSMVSRLAPDIEIEMETSAQ